MQKQRTYRTDPAWVFTIIVKARRADESSIVIRVFELFEHQDRTRDHLTMEVRQSDRTIFKRGQLWVGSPVAGWRSGLDGRDAREAVLGAVAMAPGDTDIDYYGGYSDEQRAWAVEHGQWLTLKRERRYAE